MNKSMQSTALSVIGVISVVAATGGLYLNFVKPVMRWPIIVAALVLIAVAVIGLIGHERVRGRREADPVAPYESMESVDDNDGEGQSTRPRPWTAHRLAPDRPLPAARCRHAGTARGVLRRA